MRRVLIVVLMALLALPAVAAAAKQPTATGTGGAAATADELATDAAIDVLDRGGNAVDAAVAAAAVLGVTEPFSCGIGGGGFMVIHTADGDLATIDSRETAPAAMGPDAFFENGAPIPFADARYSGRSAGVPGTVRGWERALRDYGTLDLGRLLRPAIRVARHGFAVDETFVAQTAENLGFFDDVPSTRDLYLDPDGTPRDVGTTLRNPDLARAYERIAVLGPRGFYRGPIAEAILDATRRPPVAGDADHAWRAGAMTREDLRGYRALERAPARSRWNDLELVGMGPPSSGATTVGEIFNVLEGFDLEDADRAQALHLFFEAARVTYADRGMWVADPAFFDVPLEGLLSDAFAAERRALIDPLRAGTSPLPAGDPRPYDAVPAPAAATAETEGVSTTHLTVADAEGTIVTYTFTIESTGGNGIVVPGWGFLLNNELTDFNYSSLDHANRVEGGKRPRSSIAPTIVLRDGEPILALGSPGGSMIPTTVAQILLGRFALGDSLPAALAAPRASQRNTPATVAEPAFLASPEAQALAAYGHTFTQQAEIGAATAIELLGDGRLLAVAEPARRGGGSAAVTRP